jgi:catechol 2,3-dioxygenase-like lactoylglutathione lyase family enzyme
MKINLHRNHAEFEPKARSGQPGSADLCFLNDAPPDEWQAHLHAIVVKVEESSVGRTGATGPILSLYLRDPDAHLIDFSTPL